MTEIGFDSQSFGVPATDDHCADVCGPGSANAFPLMMRRKFVGQTSGKVVRLADIYRIPAIISRQPAKYVDAAKGIECHSDSVVLEFISPATGSGPNKTRKGAD